MTFSRPDVSVCIPVVNGSEFLGSAIASAMNQTGLSVEVLVGDNASTDESVEIAKRWRDANVFAFSERVGMGANWNRLLAEARAPWVLILPCDDFLAPGALARALAAAAAHPKASFIAGATQICGRSGCSLFRVQRLPAGCFTKSHLRERILNSPRNLIGEPGAVLFRRDIWEEGLGFDDAFRYFIDVDFWLALLNAGDLVSLSEVAAIFRVHGQSTSFRTAHTIATEFRRFRAKHNAPTQLPLGVRMWLEMSVQLRRAATVFLNRL